MITVIQRVSTASVTVESKLIGSINQGIAALVAVEPNDNESNVTRLAQRLVKYRIFCDNHDRMNLSVKDISGGLLLIPQFTLAADTERGLRPSFSSAAPADEGRRMFEFFVATVKANHDDVESGDFGANMQVELINDGPITFVLRQPGPQSNA